MRNKSLIGSFLLLTSLMSAASSVCLAEEAGMSAARAEIDQMAARFSEAYARGDAKAMSAFYTDDAIAFPPGNEMVKGRQAIQEMWQSTMDSGVKSLALTVLDVGASGDLAHATGTAVLNVQPSGQVPTTASVKYVVVWKRQPDGWKLHREIWNDLPAK